MLHVTGTIHQVPTVCDPCLLIHVVVMFVFEPCVFNVASPDSADCATCYSLLWQICLFNHALRFHVPAVLWFASQVTDLHSTNRLSIVNLHLLLIMMIVDHLQHKPIPS